MPATKPNPDGKAETPVRKRRGFPVLPTLMVLVALPMLISFGVWQLQRMHWKEALLQELQHNSQLPQVEVAPSASLDGFMFRKVRISDLTCGALPTEITAGRNAKGQSGYSLIFECRSGTNRLATNVGWSDRMLLAIDPKDFVPERGAYVGVLTPATPETADKPHFYLDVAQAPLLPSAPPSVESISNNHLSYAIQWFSFAAILAIIYGLWLRRWLAQQGPRA